MTNFTKIQFSKVVFGAVLNFYFNLLKLLLKLLFHLINKEIRTLDLYLSQTFLFFEYISELLEPSSAYSKLQFFINKLTVVYGYPKCTFWNKNVYDKTQVCWFLW